MNNQEPFTIPFYMATPPAMPRFLIVAGNQRHIHGNPVQEYPAGAAFFHCSYVYYNNAQGKITIAISNFFRTKSIKEKGKKSEPGANSLFSFVPFVFLALNESF